MQIYIHYIILFFNILMKIRYWFGLHFQIFVVGMIFKLTKASWSRML